ncbi:hypothetical protein B0J15DRAFT_574633, partial [Fusarium solani]
MLHKLVAHFLTSLLVATPALAATYGHLDPARCVDPSGMKKCVDKVNEEQQRCINTGCEDSASGCLESTCLCASSISQMDCALTHCWDQVKKQVYSCEYQKTVQQVVKTCDDGPEEGFPFYPAPVDAPNACSCNKAKIAETVGKVLEEQNDCEGGASDAWEGLPRAELKAKVPPACCKFDNSTCHTEYNYTLPGYKDAKFYEPGKFPKNGTQTTMTNLAGTITSPISGATFTWTMNSTAHTITAASVQTTGTSASTTVSNANTTPTGAGAQATESSSEAEDKGSNASVVVPRTWSIISPVLIFFVL